MEIINRQEALLTNYEVYKVLKEEDDRHKAIKTTTKTKYPENVTTLKFEALQYLNGTACTTQSADQIALLKSQLLEYDLTKAEILQIINLRPKAPVELHLIIEECGERFAIEDLEELLELILATLPHNDDSDAADANADGDGETEPRDNANSSNMDVDNLSGDL